MGASRGTGNERDPKQTRGILRKTFELLGVIFSVSAGALGLVTALIQGDVINPVAFRLDVFFPTKNPMLIEDIVTVHVPYYHNPSTALEPVESYTDIYGQLHRVYDKAVYFEYITMRNTRSDYFVRVTSAGVIPEVIALWPSSSVTTRFDNTSNGKGYEITLSPQSIRQTSTPSLKMMYVYRNGLSPGSSYFGKNVIYKTERFSVILDFSQMANYEGLLRGAPQACVRKVGDERLQPLEVRWTRGVAFVEATNLEKGDRVRVFWNWSDTPVGKDVDCGAAMR